ncbi:MAG: hypothetical protein NVS3B12_30080 [Acidimicrobiales bacterium]
MTSIGLQQMIALVGWAEVAFITSGPSTRLRSKATHASSESRQIQARKFHSRVLDLIVVEVGEDGEHTPVVVSSVFESELEEDIRDMALDGPR